MYAIYIKTLIDDDWVHIHSSGEIQEARHMEDIWVKRGYDTKLVNTVTGRIVRTRLDPL